VLNLQPNNFDAALGMGVALRGQRKIDEAEKWYKKAAEIDGKNCGVAYDMGLLYQDYKNDPNNQNRRQAQQFYNQYVSCAQGSGRGDKKKVEDAQRRVKDIDDEFAAIEQAKKMEAENKAMQEEMERQQKEMEKQQQQQQQQAPQGGVPAPEKGKK
jgi:adenylosuccinate synthase